LRLVRLQPDGAVGFSSDQHGEDKDEKNDQ
jgi:hypothetical protein